MRRPLPPFRMRPVRKAAKRKVSLIARLEEATVSVRGERRPIKIARPATSPALKVLATRTPS